MSDSANTGNNDNARANRSAKGDGLERRVPKVVSVPEVSPVAGEPAGGEGVSGLGSMPASARAQGVASNRASAQVPNRASASTQTPTSSAASTGAAHVIPLPSLKERAASVGATPANGASAESASPAKSTATGVAVDAVANGVAAGGVGAASAAAAAPTTPAGAASAAAPTAAGANAPAGEQSAAFASPGQSAPRPSVKDQAKGKPRLRNKKSAAKNAAGAEGASASAQGDSPASEAEGANAVKAKRPSLAHLSQTNIKKTLAIVGAVLAVVIAVALFVSWGRWWRYNDAADFQGQWFSQGTEGTAVVTIDDAAIHLSGEVSYSYAIDPTAKTISYDFGTMHGQGRYWFSDDRNTLVIIDGADYTATSTFFEDIGIWLQGVLAQIQGKGTVLPASDNAIYLVKYNPSTASAGSSQSNAGMAAGADNDTEASSASSAAASGQTDAADAANTGAEAAGSDAAASPSAGAISDIAQPVVTRDSAPADSPADAGAAAGDAVAAPAEGNMDEAFGVTPGSGGE